MENIDHIAKNSLKALSTDKISQKEQNKLRRDILSGAVALSCLAVGLIYTLLFPQKEIVPALFYTIAFLVEGIPVFVAAIKGVFAKELSHAMEMLVAIAIIACYFSGQLILSVLIPFILNLAHFLEERSIMGGREVIDGLKKMQQTTAILLDGDNEVEVDAKKLKIGQKIVIKPGSIIAIDGKVVSGQSAIDQKSLTGEPQPAQVSVGDSVYAGTVNLDGKIVVEVTKEFVDSSFSNILKLLEESENISIPETRLIDKFMQYYIPLILVIAAAIALVTMDINKAIAILVVSCPCGQMLVSSAPMIAALSAATRRGIVIKNSKFIEELTEIDAVVFDKTGTVTKGELALTDIKVCDGFSKDELLALAASVAHASNHPVSRALITAVGTIEFCKDFSVKEISGKGMEGKNDNDTILFGNKSWIKEHGIEIDDDFDCEFSGSVSFVSKNGVFVGALCFNDTVRDEAKDSINMLKQGDIAKTVMLTGDRENAAQIICKTVGIDNYEAELLPEDKLKCLLKLKEEHCVLAVGDGINDALALKEAHVGIAMGAMGSDLAVQSADIALMNNNLLNIPFVIELAKKTRGIIYQNLALSIIISLAMITLSAFGVISALAGSILHNFGAFAVLINSSRILKK